MDASGHVLLASACVAANQNQGDGIGDMADLIADGSHLAGVADEFAGLTLYQVANLVAFLLVGGTDFLKFFGENIVDLV